MTDRLKRLASVFKWRGNIYVALIQSLVLMMVFYMFCRVVFYLYNRAFFPDMTLSRFTLIMTGGLRFDLSAILYLNSLFILLMIIPVEWRFRSWYRKFLSWLFHSHQCDRACSECLRHNLLWIHVKKNDAQCFPAVWERDEYLRPAA